MAEENPFLEIEKEKPRPGQKLIDILQNIVVVVFILIISYLFIVTPNQVNGSSMFPNFEDKQVLFTFRLPQILGDSDIGQNLDLNYKRGDVIIFQKPGHDEFIKRVIGVPGDTVAIKDSRVYVNDQLLVEPYLDPNLLTPQGDLLLNNGPAITVDPGYLFVMGDNRPDSLDSRFVEIGPVKRDWVVGRVIFRLLPFDKLTLIPRGG